MPVVEQRRPLVGLAADEAVELVEARAGRPAVGRAGRADLPGRGLVRLAEGGGAVAVQPQHLRQRRHAVRALPGLPGEGGGGLRDRAHVVHVMVAAAEQRGARRRAERRGVELVVAQPAVGQALHRRHVDRPAEGARLAEPHVVDQDDEHVRGAGRRLDLESRRGRGVAGIQARCCAGTGVPGSAAPYDPSAERRARTARLVLRREPLAPSKGTSPARGWRNG